MESAEALRAREEEVGRQWVWTHEAIDLVARLRTGEEGAEALRLLQSHIIELGRRRVELTVRLKEAEQRGRRVSAPLPGK